MVELFVEIMSKVNYTSQHLAPTLRAVNTCWQFFFLTNQLYIQIGETL